MHPLLGSADLRWRILAAVTGLKLLLVPAYRSTDFEVHRNWLAVTSSLPLSRWYLDETSPWTLDYPPLFAWFEWALGRAARLADPAMLDVANLGYASPATVLFQRGSVVAADALLAGAAWAACAAWGRGPAQRNALFFLLVANPGLLIVDHIHFQYNGFLLGLLLWSLLLLQRGRPVLGAAAFAALVNLKHLYAVLGPVYAVHLLRAHCRGPAAVARFTALACAVLGVCGLSLGPFIALGQLPQVLRRLFPFGRGLTHAYWAANVWALYCGADKALALALPRLGFAVSRPRAHLTGGLVQVTEFAVLPNIGPGACLAATALSMLPALWWLWRSAAGPARRALPLAVAYAGLCSFMLGYHVHEKAVLTAILPLTLTALQSRQHAGLWFLPATTGHFALLPLLFTPAEYPIKMLLLGCYTLAAHLLLRACLCESPQGDAVSPQGPAAGGAGDGGGAEATRPAPQQPLEEGPRLLGRGEAVYLWGLVAVELLRLASERLLGERLPFLGLMGVSLYSALGLLWAWVRLCRVFLCRQGEGLAEKAE